MFWMRMWTRLRAWRSGSPYDGRARGLHQARVMGTVGSVGEGVAEIGRRKQRFDTDRPIAHEALREVRCLWSRLSGELGSALDDGLN
jgi:hypothetical protein